MSLREYTRKRDFQKTAEPPAAKSASGNEHRFVIQKHAASRLHYDFRLEIEGALKSWAVPKGVPFKKAEKRLAMQVEDHPVSYREFEGVIPKGQYGGGTVMVWDIGTFEPLGSPSPQRDLNEGKLHFALHGKKLNGEWTLVRMHGSENEWLLIKSAKNLKPVTKAQDDRSALSGRSMAEIGKAPDALWHSSHADSSNGSQKPARKSRKPALHFIQPMKAKLVETPPSGEDWSYELKFDGYRALALKSGDAVELLSSNGKRFNERFPEIADAVAQLAEETLILDGEIVALDERGRSSFQMLQAYDIGKTKSPLAFYVFDLLQRGKDELLNEPLSKRRELLEQCIANAGEPLRMSSPLGGSAHALLKEVQRLGLEGIIAKRDRSHYEPGQRSGDWVKIKCVQEQEFVIGGYSPPGGTRKHFGALLIGYYEAKQLRFCGKVGTGFDQALLRSLHARMQALEQVDCPFVNLPETKSSRWSPTLTAREMKKCHWLEPKLVAQIRFTEWTDEDKLRHPVFLGLREDKNASEVGRERAGK